jgi:hypothetical protein
MHGAWLPWLAANADVLGFDSPLTAQRLMKAADKYVVNDAFGEAKANSALTPSMTTRRQIGS